MVAEAAQGRPDLGVTARIDVDQGHQLRLVPVFQHSLVLVEAGEKVVYRNEVPTVIRPGEIVALEIGAQVTLDNRPDPRLGRYRARVLAFDAGLIKALHPTAEAVAAEAGHWPDRPAPARRDQGWRHIVPFDGLRQAVAHAAAGLAEPALPFPLVRHRLEEVIIALAAQGFLWPGRPDLSLADDVRLMLAARPTRPWSAADVARDFAISEATLRRRLAAEDASFRALLTEARLTHGLMLLQTSRLGIAEVALASGYESPSRFAARFRERFGVPPSAIRSGLSESG